MLHVYSDFNWGIPLTLNEDMAFLLEAINPDDAILMYPVSIFGKSEGGGVEYHITVNWGKWDKSEDELRETLGELLVGESLSFPGFSEWVPGVFPGREKKFYVLQLPQLKGHINRLRRKIRSVFEDRFNDAYMPHISVSEDLYRQIVENKITVSEARVVVDKLQIRLGNKVLDVLKEEDLFEARYPLPAAQKMVLQDMVLNKRDWREWPGGFFVPSDEQRVKVQERLFSVYVLWHVIRSLVRKGFVREKLKNGIRFFEVTASGERQV